MTLTHRALAIIALAALVLCLGCKPELPPVFNDYENSCPVWIAATNGCPIIIIKPSVITNEWRLQVEFRGSNDWVIRRLRP